MSCSRPNMTRYSSWDGYAFKGRRRQEVHIGDRQKIDDSYFLQDIPCGECDLCLLENRYSRALRIMLEADFWPERTYFITLTYDNAHLTSEELDHDDWAQFMKDFRAKFCQAKYCNIRDRGTLRHGQEYSKTFKKIKQVMSGEYGDEFGRKHFHGIIFNHNFSDIEVVLCDDGSPAVSKKGNIIRTSKSLRDVWKKGNVQVEEITFDLALYVGAYITDRGEEDAPDSSYDKKQYGRLGNGIGFSWIEKWWKDVLRAGKVMLRDRDYPIPRMFHRWMAEVICPKEYAAYKQKKVLKLLNDRVQSIKKGDGPLRRSRAKGRIHSVKKQVRSYYEQAPSRVNKSQPFNG